MSTRNTFWEKVFQDFNEIKQHKALNLRVIIKLDKDDSFCLKEVKKKKNYKRKQQQQQ